MTNNLGLLFENAEVKLIVEIEDTTPDLQTLFIRFVAKNLGIKQLPSIKILSKRKEGMTFGCYDPKDKEVSVLKLGRAMADFFRTLAHELVHYKQDEDKRIPEKMQGRNKQLEDEANTKAADLVYMFGLDHPEIYSTEEA